MSKDRRAEQQLDDRQKRIILEMYERDPDEVGVGFVQERFAAYELTPDAIREVVSLERKKRRARVGAATDWAARYAESAQ